jgi:flotillin
MNLFSLLTWAIIIFFILVIGYLVVRFRYKKAGPDEALIIFGRRKVFGRKVRDEKGAVEGYRVVRGGGTFVWPAWEQYEYLSLKMMTLDIDLRHVYTQRGIPINVKAVAQVKVGGDIPHVSKAAEGFLGLPPDQIRDTIKETVARFEGSRGIPGPAARSDPGHDQGDGRGTPPRDHRHADSRGAVP